MSLIYEQYINMKQGNLKYMYSKTTAGTSTKTRETRKSNNQKLAFKI